MPSESPQPHSLTDVPPGVGDVDLCMSTPQRTRESPPKGCLAQLSHKTSALAFRIIPPGGILSSAFNIASASIGAGVLGLPAASDTTGLVLALIYLTIITYMSIYSMSIVAIASQKTGLRSFELLARWLFPAYHYAFSYVTAFIRFFHSFSACVAYIISVGNCMDPIFKEAYERSPSSSALKFFSSTSGNRVITCIIWGAVMVPMVIPKHVDSMRYVSMGAISFIVYLTIIIVVHSGMHGMKGGENRIILSGPQEAGQDGEVYLFRTGNRVVQGVGVFMFAYVCQITASEVLWDMKPEIRTTKTYTQAATLGMVVCGILYSLVSVFGYLDFGSGQVMNKSLLLFYNPLSEPEFMVAYIGVLMKLCVSYGLLTLAARNSVYYLLGWDRKYASSKCDESASTEALDKKMDTVDEVNPVNVPNEAAYVDNIPFWKHLIVVLILAVTSLLCGLFIPNINTVFGFAGAISGSFVAFISPALFMMYSGGFSLRAVGWFHYVNTYALLVCGIVGMIFGTGGTIYNTIIG